MLVQTPALAADPVPTTSAEAKVLVDKLTAQQRDAEQQFNAVNEKYTNTQGKLDERTAQILQQDDKVKHLRSSISSLALSRYHNKGKETSQALLSATTEDTIRRLSTIAHVDTTLNTSLQNLQAQSGYLNELKRQQTVDAAKAKDEADQLGDLDKKAKDSLARATALLGQLTDADRQNYEEQQRKQASDAVSRSKYAAQTPTQPTTPNTADADGRDPATNQQSNAKSDQAAPASTAGGLKSSANARGNFYDRGSCVWWAYERRGQLGAPVSSGWGSALTWPSGASAEGFTVDHNPVVGAVYIAPPGVQGATGHGHAGVVESVNPDGSYTISEMNAPVAGVLTYSTHSAASRGSVYFIH